MNFEKLKSVAGACVYMLLAFSVSTNAATIDQLDSGISVESWLVERGYEIPVLSFDITHDYGELAKDIRVENIIRDKDGSTRFQLSHMGPISRQVFASVRWVEQDNGFTRTIITNIADGHQSEYLIRTAELPPINQQDKISDRSFLDELERMDDQNTECVSCIFIFTIVVACMVSEIRAFQQCNATCRNLGGVKYFETGTCAATGTECICWVQPRKTSRDF